MDLIDKIIDYNKEKLVFLKEYLDANEMIQNMSDSNNVSAIKELADKKRRLITAIDIIDDKIVKGISELKNLEGVADLSKMDVKKHPALRTLKIVSGNVLRQMVSLKQSDEVTKATIDKMFCSVKGANSVIDKNKLYYYTDRLFNK